MRHIEDDGGPRLWAMPRSTSQTSPRLGIFLLVEHGEDSCGGRSQFFVSHVAMAELRGSMNDDGTELPFLWPKRSNFASRWAVAVLMGNV